ncbi:MULTISPECIES: response regulator transcription factor [unclassified Pseudoalteromonas]|uniref:response regulator transcription factor n=1 Tax=unclassified Pseudoalteromonas TaxID=194690 RepID=UPI0009E21BC0|nr:MULTISPECIES: response regulator transcription factor [unclassified Pseudoalteromonas]
MNQSIFIVEDDLKLASLLNDYFTEFDFETTVITSGDDAADSIIVRQPDLVILDLRLPKIDGLTICREIRNKYQGVILMLTASGDDIDQVAALELGVDDFVQKPIQPRVLLARIRMLLRRTVKRINSDNSKEITLGSLTVNNALKSCTLDDQLVLLTPSEFALLWQLVSQPDTALSREQLQKSFTGLEYDGTNRIIDNKIAQIRKKLKDDSNRPKGIITVRNKGYMFVPDYWSN